MGEDRDRLNKDGVSSLDIIDELAEPPVGLLIATTLRILMLR